MKPLLSVLVDTYNHEKYIEQTLNSVVEQGFSAAEMEIVVVDDGSTDRTPEIIQKFAPRVKHVRKKNGGQASAFNAGFQECKGEIIALLDGDDWFAKGKIAAVAEALEAHPEVSAVSHGYYEYHEETGEAKACMPPTELRLDLKTPEAALLALRWWSYLLMGALTVRREVLERIMPIPEVLVFSADNPIQLASLALGVLVMPAPLCYYRMHAQNLYAIDKKDDAKALRKCEMVDRTCRLLHPMLQKLGVSRESASAFLDGFWVDTNRYRLRTFGGSPIKTFETEMIHFRAEVKKPTLGYLLFKYLVVGAATLLMPPRQFYRVRDWYAHEDVGRYRERLLKAGKP